MKREGGGRREKELEVEDLAAKHEFRQWCKITSTGHWREVKPGETRAWLEIGVALGERASNEWKRTRDGRHQQVQPLVDKAKDSMIDGENEWGIQMLATMGEMQT